MLYCHQMVIVMKMLPVLSLMLIVLAGSKENSPARSHGPLEGDAFWNRIVQHEDGDICDPADDDDENEE